MDPFTLTAHALREPWRLWTGHLTHFGWAHALANLTALGVPLILLDNQDRRRFLAASFLLAPLLSLVLLPSLRDGQYRGASGLACALWSWAGLQLIRTPKRLVPGLLLLGGLALKLGFETLFGLGVLPVHQAWRPLLEVHFWGALLGLLTAWAPLLHPHRERPGRACPSGPPGTLDQG